MRLAAILPPVRRTAEATPDSRDRVIDAVRGVALFVVVFGHLIMACIHWPANGAPIVGNIMADYPDMQYLTWLLQVMPIFFAFGGASSVIAWRKADAGNVLYSAWMWGRIRRLLRPVIVYFAIMAIIGMLVTRLAGDAAAPLLSIIAQPLWFLGVYGVVLLFLPLAFWVHQHNKALMFLILIPLGALVSVGVTVLGWPSALGFLNFIFVWLAIQQLGFFWAENTRTRTWVTVALTSFLINAALVYYGPWPRSLVGLPGDILDYDSITLFGTTFNVPGYHGEYSNMAPPSLILLLHGFTLVSIIFILRKPLDRLLHRPRVWLAVTFMMLTAMSLYIWHLLAIVMSVATLHYLGFNPPTHLVTSGNLKGWPEPDSTGAYLTWFLLFLVFFLIYLSIIVLLTWSTEYRPLPIWDSRPKHGVLPQNAPGWLYVTGVVISGLMVSLSVLIIALIGFAGFPFNNANWSGLTLNSGVAMLTLILGALIMRGLTKQPLVPQEPTSETVESKPN